MTQVDIHALAGAYALDALDDIERAAFSRHLGQCSTCALDVASLREATARLADASWETPPPGMRAAVLGEISRTRQVGPAPERPDRDRLTRWRRWTAGAVAAGIIAVGAAATSYVVQDQRVQQERQASAQARAVQSVLAAPDALSRRAGVTGGGDLTVVVSRSRAAGVALLSGLPAPDRAHAYQLWLMRDNVPAPSRVLDAGQPSGALLVDQLGDADGLAVTLEPAGGSAAPTTNVLASVPLS